VEALCKALEENDTLLSMYLESNSISAKGAALIGGILANKYKLSKLNLNNNPIKDEGLLKISEGLEENETLRVITLQNIGMTF
jgi:hypothetical protein